MISYEQLLKEMKRQVDVAQATNDERVVREAVTAVKALCEVMLGDRQTTQQPVQSQRQVVQRTPVTANEVQSIPSTTSKPLVEEDANGDSLFEF